jgi:hypothetical protein
MLAGRGRMIQVLGVYEHITPALAVRNGSLRMTPNADWHFGDDLGRRNIGRLQAWKEWFDGRGFGCEPRDRWLAFCACAKSLIWLFHALVIEFTECIGIS